MIDAILGTGTQGAARDVSLAAIQSINRDYPFAEKVAVDIPSGMPSDTSELTGESVNVGYTVTFTAPKRGQVLSPARAGQLIVAPLGSRASFCDSNPGLRLYLTEKEELFTLFSPRPETSNKVCTATCLWSVDRSARAEPRP